MSERERIDEAAKRLREAATRPTLIKTEFTQCLRGDLLLLVDELQAMRRRVPTLCGCEQGVTE